MTTLEELATRLAAIEQQVADLDGEVRDRHEQLARRVSALEADQFSLTEQIRIAASAADRAVVGLDEIEDILTEVDERSGDTAARFQAAMQQRNAALGAMPIPQAPPVSGEPDAEEHAEDQGGQRPTLDVLHAWVSEHIAPLVRRVTATGEGGGIRWCRQWWLHYDAIQRFEALYLVFEELSEQDTLSWLSAYLRDHLDPHLATLTNPYGPFYSCSLQRHSDTGIPLGTTALDLAEHAAPESQHTTTSDVDDQVAGDTTGGTK